MMDCFYIIESHPGWYQLILSDVFYCVSAGPSLDTLIKVMRRYVRKYRTKGKLFRALQEVMNNNKVSIITQQDLKETLKTRSQQFAALVEKNVEEALRENKNDSPLARNNLRKKLFVPAVPRVEDDLPELTLDIVLTNPPVEEVPHTTVKVKPLRLLRPAKV